MGWSLGSLIGDVSSAVSNIGHGISNFVHNPGAEIGSIGTHLAHNPLARTAATAAAAYFGGPLLAGYTGLGAGASGALIGAGTTAALGGNRASIAMGGLSGYGAGTYGGGGSLFGGGSSGGTALDPMGASSPYFAQAQAEAAAGNTIQADALAQQAGFPDYATMMGSGGTSLGSGIMSSLGGGGSLLGKGLMAYGGLSLLGMSRQNQQQMQGYANASNPLAPYQPQYASQLNQLMGNPNLITTMPGYQAGLTGVERGMAAQGYAGSGNMLAQLGQYSGNFFNNQVNQLAGLSTQNASAPGQMMGNYLPTATGQQMSGLGLLAAPWLLPNSMGMQS